MNRTEGKKEKSLKVKIQGDRNRMVPVAAVRSGVITGKTRVR